MVSVGHVAALVPVIGPCHANAYGCNDEAIAEADILVCLIRSRAAKLGSLLNRNS